MRTERLKAWLSPLVAALGVFALALQVRDQGIDLLEDGLWLLAADMLGQGKALYRELVLRDGPTDAGMLRAFFALLGTRAATLAIFKAVVDGAAAGLAFAAARRLGAGRWAWWAAIGVLALGPFPPRYVLALGAALCALHWLDGRRSPLLSILLGLLLGLCSLAGLDGLILSGGITLVLLLELRSPASQLARRQLLLPGLAFAIPWGIALFNGAMQLALPAAFDQVVLAGLERVGDQLRAIPGTGYLRILSGAGIPSSPFQSLQTGETIDAIVPAQELLRDLSFRLRTILLPVLVIFAWRRVAWRNGSERVLLVLATLPLLTLILRGSAGFVDRAWLGGIILLPALLAGLEKTSLRRLSLSLLPLLLLGLSVLEFGWLSTHRHREGLAMWESTRAGVALAEGRIDEVEAVFGALGHSHEALLIWPAVPGLHFLAARAPALPQVVLLDQRVRHGDRLAEQLERVAPRHVLLGLAWHFGAEEIETLAPGVWEQLRRDYWVFGNLREGGFRMRVLERVPDGESLAEVSLQQRLPQIEQTVGNGTGPAMRPGLEVAQSFEVGSGDFEGIAVRWRTQRTNVVVPVRVRIWMFREGHWGNLIRFDDLELSIAGDLHRSYVRFDPVYETAGTRLAVSFEVREELDYDLRLLWHRREGDTDERDFYPSGNAMIQLDPVNADLYFLTW